MLTQEEKRDRAKALADARRREREEKIARELAEKYDATVNRLYGPGNE